MHHHFDDKHFGPHPFESKPPYEGGFFGRRAPKGDLEPIILGLLKEKPMHGYEIIRTLEERSHGMWRPSAGSVYPILQLLEEKELVTGQEEHGKKVYSLTNKGESEAQTCHTHHHHTWGARIHAGKHFKDLRHVIRESALLLKQIAFTGTEEQMQEVKTIVLETRDRLRAVANPKGEE